MPVYRIDSDVLEHLARRLAEAADSLEETCDAARRTMLEHGYVASSSSVSSAAVATGVWGRTWAASLRTRIILATRETTHPSAPPGVSYALDMHVPSPRRDWQIFAGIPHAAAAAAAATALRSTDEAGTDLAVALLDALEAGNTEEVLMTLDRLTRHLTDADLLVAFFRTLDADIVGLLPAMIVDLDVVEDELHRYLGPIASGLAFLDHGGDLPFTIDLLMAGHEDRSVSPIIYFGLAEFSAGATLSAVLPVLGALDAGETLLDGPRYRLPDGSFASPDPRVAALERLAGLDAADRRSVIRTLVEAGLLRALVSPGTPMQDGGSAAGRLLLGVGDSADDIDLLAAAMAELDGETPVHVVVAVTAAVAPHLTSLIPEPVAWGPGALQIEQTPLRTALDELPDLGRSVVASFLHVAARHDDARHILDLAAAAVVVDQLMAAVAGADVAGLPASEVGAAIAAPTTRIADDVGTLLGMVLAAETAVDMERARAADQMAETTLEALSIGFGLLAGAVAGGVGAQAFARTVVAEVAGSSVVADRAVASNGLGTDNVEVALVESVGGLIAIEDLATFTIALGLAEHGVIELPDGLVDISGGIVRASPAQWAALAEAVAEAGILPELAFTAAADVQSAATRLLEDAVLPDDDGPDDDGPDD